MLSPIKLNELVDLVCVLFTPVQFSLIQDSVREGSEGEEDQWEEAALGEDPKEVEKNSLPVRVIRNEQYTVVMTICEAVLFISLNSTLVFLLEACFHRVLLP